METQKLVRSTRRRLCCVLGVLLVPGTGSKAQSTDSYTPMDPIPEVIETLPDPCDNPTTRMWGPDDQKGNLNYLTAERVRGTAKSLFSIWAFRSSIFCCSRINSIRGDTP